MLSPQRRALTIGMVATVTLVAVEALAVITILPDIEDDLVGLSWYGWVTTAFFLGILIGIVVAGDQADRVGLGRPFVAGLVMFSAGLVIGGLAPSMPILAGGRFVQGLGAGVVPAIGYVAIGRMYPASLRPRMFAILSTAWVVPGVIGPTIAERVSALVGWRWVFLGLLPLVIVAGCVTAPTMLRIRAPEAVAPAESTRRRLADAVQLSAGAALFVGALTANAWLVAPMLVVGALLGVSAFRRLTPPGTMRAMPQLPAIIATRGLLTFAFFGADTFVPHTLTDARLTSTASGSIAVTTSTLGWTTASWIQERFVARVGGRMLIRAGFALLALGIAGVALTAAFADVPVWVIHLSWGIGGLGMGLSYSVHSQLTLALSPESRLGWHTAALQLSDNLGIALGAGLTGAAVTFTDGRDLATGSGVALSLLIPASVAAVGLCVASRRHYPDRAQPVVPAAHHPGADALMSPG